MRHGPINLRLRGIPYAINNEWFSGKSNIRTYSIEELMGTKLRALYQRAKGRDLYDLWMTITQLKIDCKKILEGFHYYCSKQNIKISRTEFEKNLSDKMQSTDFLSDAKKVLPEDYSWNPGQAYKVVLSKLVEKLPGAPWQGKEKQAT